MSFISVVLILLPLIVKLTLDGYRILVEKEEVNHGKSLTLAVAVGIVISYVVWRIEPVQYYFQPALLSWSVFWAFFDTTLNLITGKKWSYIDANIQSGGIHSTSDKVYAMVGILGVLFAKAWFLALGLFVYFGWHVITGLY